MQKVSSPTLARWVRPIIAGLVSASLIGGFAAPAYAKSLDDQRKDVRKAITVAKDDVKDSEAAVKSAASKLADSQTRLSQAKTKLAELQADLSEAKEVQSDIAAELKKARQELADATEAAIQAAEEVEEQRALIGIAVRHEFQKQTDLIDITFALGAESPADLSQRLQWSTVIFNSTSAEMDRLTELEAELEAARVAQEKAEAKVAERDKAAKAQVASVENLTDQAASQTASVEKLVKENKEAQKDAQSELAKDKAEYEQLKKQEAKITAAIKKAAEEAAKSGQKVSSAGFVRPVPGAISSKYGPRYHPILHYTRMHGGVDMRAGCSTPIKAMEDGKVTRVSNGYSGGFGKMTVITYGEYKGKIISSTYAHQSKIIVKNGQKVKRGQVVGYVGTTGLSTGCHLHLEMHENSTRVNPAKYL